VSPLRQRLASASVIVSSGRALGSAFHEVGGSLWIQLVAVSGVIACAYVLPAEGLAGGACWWQKYFGFDCPGCGLTRSFVAMAHGQFDEAVACNAAGPLLFFGALVLLTDRAARLAFDRRLYLPGGEDKFFGLALIVMLSNWIIKVAI
jgi:hypothetical protein